MIIFENLVDKDKTKKQKITVKVLLVPLFYNSMIFLRGGIIPTRNFAL